MPGFLDWKKKGCANSWQSENETPIGCAFVSRMSTRPFIFVAVAKDCKSSNCDETSLKSYCWRTEMTQWLKAITLAFCASWSSCILCNLALWSIFSNIFTLPRTDLGALCCSSLPSPISSLSGGGTGVEGFSIGRPKVGFAAIGGGQPLEDAPGISLPAAAEGFDLYS